MSIMLLAACGLALLVLVAVVIGAVLLMQSSSQDSVSAARQGWMDSRTDKDKQG